MPNQVDIEVKVKDSATGPMTSIGATSDKLSAKVGGMVKGIGDKIGGELGELLNKGGEAFEKFGEAGTGAWGKLTVGGGVVAGLGVALSAFGSESKAAGQQLEASVESTGVAFSDYSKQVDAAKSKGEDFGHSGTDVERALTSLIQKTGDVAQSMKYMGLVEDLAAAKHISLAAAATLVGSALNGGTKLFKQYGVAVQSGSQSLEMIDTNLGKVAQRLEGQAAASADTFSGKIEGVKEHVTAFAETLANQAGVALTWFGTGIGAASGVIDIFAARSARLAAKQLAVAEANTVEAASATQAAAANTAAAESETALAAAGGRVAASQGTAAAATGVSRAAAVGGAGAFLALAAAMVLGVREIDKLSKGSDDFGKDQDVLAAALEADGNALGVQTRAAVAAQLQTQGLADKAAKAGITMDDLTAAVFGSADGLRALEDRWRASGKPSTDTLAALEFLQGAYTKDTDAIARNKAATDDATASNDVAGMSFYGLSAQIDKNSAEFKAAANYADSYSKALDELSNDTIDASERQDKFSLSMVTLRKDLEDNGRAVDGNTEGAIKNRGALMDQIKAVNDIAAKQIQAGVATTTVNATLAANETSLRNAAVAAGLNKDQVDALIKKYAVVPANIQTQITLDAQQAFNAADTLIGKLNILAGLAARADNIDFLNLSRGIDRYAPGAGGGGSAYDRYTGGIIGGAATGGARHGRTLVGEHGPEVVDLPVGSHVNSNPDSQAMFGGGGGAATVTLVVESGGSRMDDLIVELIRKAVRVRGGNVQKALGQ